MTQLESGRRGGAERPGRVEPKRIPCHVLFRSGVLGESSLGTSGRTAGATSLLSPRASPPRFRSRASSLSTKPLHCNLAKFARLQYCHDAERGAIVRALISKKMQDYNEAMMLKEAQPWWP